MGNAILHKDNTLFHNMTHSTEQQLTFHTHPLKADIVARWERGDTSQSVNEWLVKEHPDLTLSINTLCKHHKTYKKNIDALPSKKDVKTSVDKIASKVEKLLWQTVRDCQRIKKDKTLSPKDWQYIDQQQQNAIEKILRIQERSGDTRDLSTVLSEMFGRMQLGQDVDVDDIVNKDITEEEKLEIVTEVDKENDNTKST